MQREATCLITMVCVCLAQTVDDSTPTPAPYVGGIGLNSPPQQNFVMNP